MCLKNVYCTDRKYYTFSCSYNDIHLDIVVPTLTYVADYHVVPFRDRCQELIFSNIKTVFDDHSRSRKLYIVFRSKNANICICYYKRDKHILVSIVGILRASSVSHS